MDEQQHAKTQQPSKLAFTNVFSPIVAAVKLEMVLDEMGRRFEDRPRYRHSSSSDPKLSLQEVTEALTEIDETMGGRALGMFDGAIMWPETEKEQLNLALKRAQWAETVKAQIAKADPLDQCSKKSKTMRDANGDAKRIYARWLKLLGEFVQKNVWNLSADLPMAIEAAFLKQLNDFKFVPGTDASKAREEVAGQLVDLKRIAKEALKQELAGALLVKVVTDAAQASRPALASTLQTLGPKRAVEALKPGDAFEHMMDMVLLNESTKPAVKPKYTQEETAAYKKKKAAKKAKKQKQSAAADTSSDDTEQVAAAGVPRQQRSPADKKKWLATEEGKEWREKQQCFRCGRVGHLKGDAECSGRCGICGKDHNMKSAHESELMETLQARLKEKEDE